VPSEISDLFLHVSYLASQSEGIKFGDLLMSVAGLRKTRFFQKKTTHPVFFCCFFKKKRFFVFLKKKQDFVKILFFLFLRKMEKPYS